MSSYNVSFGQPFTSVTPATAQITEALSRGAEKFAEEAAQSIKRTPSELVKTIEILAVQVSKLESTVQSLGNELQHRNREVADLKSKVSVLLDEEREDSPLLSPKRGLKEEIEEIAYLPPLEEEVNVDNSALCTSKIALVVVAGKAAETLFSIGRFFLKFTTSDESQHFYGANYPYHAGGTENISHTDSHPMESKKPASGDCSGMYLSYEQSLFF